MKSRTTTRFRKAFADLPAEVQERAREAYRTFRMNPNHPSLRVKKVHPSLPIYSARIGLHYHAIGELLDEDSNLWFWIGSHSAYDQLLRRL